ncbi:MAG: putative peptidoglycan glycosyltransferase FtsW [Pseudomonadota bacterium]|nr:putative peptidoglycan glycosyltransferase FtsW [Pseudomonadota bacterium]
MVNFSRQSHNAVVKWLWTVDKVTLFVSLALLVIGIILDITASPAIANRLKLDDFALVRKQAQFAVLSVIVMLGLSLFSLKTIRRISILGFGVLLIFLVLTLFFGVEIKGARRWIYILGFSLQPSELMKPIFIVLTAWLLERGKKLDYFQGQAFAIAAYLVVVCLLLLQPDVGMTLLVTAVFGLQLFLAGLPWFFVGAAFVGGIVSLTVLYFTFPHFRARVDQFLYGSDETSFQINRAMAAFQNGNLVGKGPGEGTVKLSIPDAHTDFVFAVAGEEYGVWLCLVIILLFSVIVIRALKLSMKESNLFVMYAEVGLAASLGVQAFVNMASSLHIIPTKGMTLPFISYGGSSLLGTAIEVGMLLAITRKNTASEDKDMY